MHTDKLPLIAYAPHPTTGATVQIRRGENGYHPVITDGAPEVLNRLKGITPQQAAAMLAGSMFGWDCPGADPDRLTEAEAILLITPPARRAAL